MPVLFVGHGTPMNAIEDNVWSRAFVALGRALPRPKAVLAISAHWFVDGTWLTANPHPETIHDFGGFPQPLYEVRYPAPGDVVLAERVASLVGPEHASMRLDWGLDHGTWSVARHLWPNADVPIVQLSIDRHKSGAQHFELGRAVSALRDEGVLVLGSGNITHNLREAFVAMRVGDTTTPDWARDFDTAVARALTDRDEHFLVETWREGELAQRAHPTIDHYLPLIYVVGASDAHDHVTFPIEGFDGGSLSMRSVLFS
jgi:4,5-DOPA dioxygenase extradiol